MVSGPQILCLNKYCVCEVIRFSLLDAGHKCVTVHQCFKQPCPPCKERVVRDLPCGHRKELECYIDINQYECLETCERILPNPLCRHKCQNLCYQPCGPCHVSNPRNYR